MARALQWTLMYARQTLAQSRVDFGHRGLLGPEILTRAELPKRRGSAVADQSALR
jgi:hypothetical protein